MLTKLRNKYKALSLFDKIVIPLAILAMIVTAAIFTQGEVNPLTTAAVVIGFFIVLHFVLIQPAGVFAVIVLIVQAFVLGYVSTAYGYAAVDYSNMKTDILFGPVAAVALTLISVWATWKWASGRWWLKLMWAFLMIDFIGPIIASTIHYGSSFIWAIVFSLILLALVCLPWARILMRKSYQERNKELSSEMKINQSTTAVRNVISPISGIQVFDTHPSDLADFIVKKKRKEYHVTVLGYKSDLDIKGDDIYYRKRNIKKFIFELAYNAKDRKRIPVVINYSDPHDSFVELNLKDTKSSRKKYPIIITTLPVFMSILEDKGLNQVSTKE